MPKALKVKNIVRRSSSSLIAKLTLAIVVFTVLMNLVQLVSTALSRGHVLKDYFTDQVRGKMGMVEQLTKARLDELDSYVSSLPLVYPQVDTLLSAGDYAAVGHFLADNVTARGLQGYVLMDSKFNLVSTNYKSYTQAQLEKVRELMRYVSTTPSKEYNGYADVMGTGVGIVTVHVWPDSQGRDAVIAMVCYDSVENDGYLIKMAALIQSEQSVYRGDYISATSYDGHDIDIHGLPIPQLWVPDSLQTKRKNIVLTEKAGAEYVFSAYIPLFDHHGDLIGIHHIWLDQDVKVEVGRRMRNSVIVVAVIFSALFIWLFRIFMRRHLVKPLLSLRDDAERIASGDLSREVAVPRTRDEIEQLAEAMSSMRNSLRGTLEVMSQTGSVIQSSSAHIGRASQSLSKLAETQAGRLQDVTASLGAVSGSIKANVTNAAETNTLMAQATGALNGIADKATESLEATRKVVGSLRSINSLVGQTNILSLNAAVEAARAGTQGRGFAVVAKSVGGLAEQTRRTAEEMTVTSQTSIAGADNINKLIDELVPQLERVADSVRAMTDVSREQGAGLDQISDAAAALNNATKETAADADELAQRASDLAAQALKMKNLLDSFRL